MASVRHVRPGEADGLQAGDFDLFLRVDDGGCRTVRDGAMIDRTALLRLRSRRLDYRAIPLSGAFRDMVQELGFIPDALPYRRDGRPSEPPPY